MASRRRTAPVEVLADRLLEAWRALRVDDIRTHLHGRPIVSDDAVAALEQLEPADRAWVRSVIDDTHRRPGTVLELVDLRARGVI